MKKVTCNVATETDQLGDRNHGEREEKGTLCKLRDNLEVAVHEKQVCEAR
jgi:hypothetical protein